jgi:hypothetical protein
MSIRLLQLVPDVAQSPQRQDADHGPLVLGSAAHVGDGARRGLSQVGSLNKGLIPRRKL